MHTIKHHILLALALGASLGMASCKNGSDDDGGTTAPPSQPLTGGTITGTVSDQSGGRLANVQVVAESNPGTTTATTNEQGFFALVDVPAGDPVLSLQACWLCGQHEGHVGR